MIARLRGILDSAGADHAVIDCNGVGYLVFCSRRTLGLMAGPREAVALHIETHVREDHIHLYGFADTAERDWFRLLTTVQGVGAKVGLAILSVLSPDQVATAIAAGDKALLARADGVGPKLAGRIASELKDKVGGIALGPAVVGLGPVAVGLTARPAETGGAAADAVSALVNLGYGRAEAFTAVARAGGKLGADATVSALIPAALRELAS
ncbi:MULTISPECIES: Holliday junction branch migration protein RuvA [Inquilinus]|jgi:Holliday junction DNA helicase RuvA|uniref:Holliday junction branch migration complex subunit RuvA n=1 Tax=Inquilinus ginsengisoli TaxID=363840 RepID=A0ABU1JML1_9PROT|nr:Holliday junction branch migration protein RuvA [Inquilinus ginsengisoli]MDR6289852.1 Holliday junction DNA helicase RuvA [Inquilinus ginsengisoli]